MKEEPSYELISLEIHDLLFIPICIVSPVERDITVMDFEDTIIADSDPVGISAQILKDTLCSVEGWLAIDNPFFMVELASEHIKGSRLFQMTNGTQMIKKYRVRSSVLPTMQAKDICHLDALIKRSGKQDLQASFYQK
jgi:hypothetical protein